MSKNLCKGIRKDGSPCQGNALDQFDGLCIAHGPTPEQAYQWRSEGGKNSATAVRLDKRMPEELRQASELVQDCMIQVKEGKMTPAAFNAICRGVQTLIALRRRNDEEMDDIRTEEIQAAAAQFLGLHANLEILEAADEMNDRQDQYRAEALVDQGFAEFEEPADPEDPPDIVLNHKGRHRFGYHNLDTAQRFLNETNEELFHFDPRESDVSSLPDTTQLLEELQENVEQSLSTLARDDIAPFDPLTGKAITRLPAGVKTSSSFSRSPLEDQDPKSVLEMQRIMAEELLLRAEEISENKDYKRRLAQLEEHKKNLEETEAFLEANGHPIGPLPAKLSWQ